MSSYIRSNSRKDLELENYFGKIRATCARKVVVTVFDLCYLLLINLPIFVLWAFYEPKKGFIDAFHSLLKPSSNIQAWRMFGFSLWMILACYVYFVLIPSKTSYQTFFSNHLGMKAVTLDDNLNWRGKLSQSQLFRANLIPVFALPMVSAIFFYFAWITNNNDWYEKLIQQGISGSSGSSSSLETKSYWIYGIRMMVAVVFFLQFHHLFTVGASKRALNWFTKSNKIVYVNVERAVVVMGSEDTPQPNKDHPFDYTVPGGSEAIKYDDDYEVEINDENSRKEIDFSEDIDLETEEFLERLKEKQKASE